MQELELHQGLGPTYTGRGQPARRPLEAGREADRKQAAAGAPGGAPRVTPFPSAASGPFSWGEGAGLWDH